MARRKLINIDIIERSQEGDRSGPFGLGTVAVDSTQHVKALQLIEEQWAEFQASEPDTDSEYISWLIKRWPKIFIREPQMHAQVYVG